MLDHGESAAMMSVFSSVTQIIESFMSKNAVVTGASSGVGQSVAIKLAKQGWNVAILARREAQLRETQARAGEAETLTALCIRSKAHWGYDARFMRLSQASLTISDADIASARVLVDGRHSVGALCEPTR